MNDRQIQLNILLSSRDIPAEQRTEVTFDRAGTLFFDWRGEGSALKSNVAKYAENGKIAAVEFEPKTRRIVEIFPPKIDQIAVVQEPDDDRDPVKVQLLMNPSLFQLMRNHPQFQQLLETLKQAWRERRQAAVAAFPGDSRIEDVLLIDRPK